jgi:hypothetical protein
MECQVSIEHIPPLPDFGERIEVRGSTSVEHYRIGLADP